MLLGLADAGTTSATLLWFLKEFNRLFCTLTVKNNPFKLFENSANFQVKTFSSRLFSGLPRNIQGSFSEILYTKSMLKFQKTYEIQQIVEANNTEFSILASTIAKK